jgi:hypothetical protein
VIVPQPPSKGDARFDQWVYLLWKSLRGIPGAVNFAAADASKVVTDSRVTANSIIVATVATNDATMKSVQAVAAAGSFTLYANAAATAETRVNFLVIN